VWAVDMASRQTLMTHSSHPRQIKSNQAKTSPKLIQCPPPERPDTSGCALVEELIDEVNDSTVPYLNHQLSDAAPPKAA
jgi:hypothetical protein